MRRWELIIVNYWKVVLIKKQNFTSTLLTQSYPSATSILCMTRLNDTLIDQLIGKDKEGSCPTQGMESHLIGIRLQLWPLFQKEMGTNVDSIKKLSEGTSSGMAGMLGVKNTAVKDSVVTAVRTFRHIFKHD